MKILFWNVQRLGGTTDDARKSVISGVVDGEKADLDMVCELTQDAQDFTPVNLNYRKKTKFQLCYGVRDANGQVQLAMAQMTATGPWIQEKFKGGTDFKKLTDRAVAQLAGQHNGATVYTYHAPASSKAKKAVSFAACSLHQQHGNNKWLIIGDMNIEPADLAKVANLGPFIKSSGLSTHSKGKELDYVVTNINGLVVARVDVDLTTAGSDHYPITATF